MPSGKILAQKEEDVAVIVDKIKKSKSVVLVDYRGLTVAQDTALRSEMRENNVEYRVLKNRAMVKAMEIAGYTELNDAFNGPTAVAFGYEDAVMPSKILSEKIKATKKMKFKGGIVEGKTLDAKGIDAVANIPAKPVLVAQLLAMLTTPMRSLAVALDQIAQKNEG